MRNEKTIKESLFGKTEKIKATGNHIPDKNLLRQPSFEREDSVIYVFCVGCGTLGEVNAISAEKLSNRATDTDAPSVSPDSFEGKYFESGACENCDSEEQYIILKDID